MCPKIKKPSEMKRSEYLQHAQNNCEVARKPLLFFMEPTLVEKKNGETEN